MADDSNESNRKDITKWLSNLLIRDVMGAPGDTTKYWSREVTLANKSYYPGEPTTIRPDFMEFSPLNQTAGGIDRGMFTVYEIKSCIQDFKSKCGHNMIGDKNYYVMTYDLYEQLNDEDPHNKFLRLNKHGVKAGVYVACSSDSIIEEEEYDKLKVYLPAYCLRNPKTGKRDETKLQLIIRAESNRNRLYSNSELLFSMLRSSQKDKIFYDKEYWYNL